MSISQWSDLPNELLEIIIDHLHTKIDLTRFSSVCESWRSSALPYRNRVVLPAKVSYLGPSHLQESSLLLTESTVYHLSPLESCAMASTSNSSPSGWIVKIKENQELGQQLHLINPLSPLRVHPLPDSFPKVLNSLQFRVFELTKSYTLQYSNLNHCNYKVALNPNQDCPSLMVVAAGVLWHLKLGQDRWTAIDDMESQLSYEDVIVYRGKFCAVDEFGRAVVVDSDLKITEIASVISGGAGDKKNLLVFNGELLLVDRYLSKKHNYMYYNIGRRTSSVKVEKFRLYKLNLDQERWVEIESLGDQILFLGEDCSYITSAKNFSGCRGNCIIYCDPEFKVYNLDYRSFAPVNQRPEYINIFNPFTPPPPPHYGPRHSNGSSGKRLCI
ncbi:F-box protein SKIP23-like [Humulus lupulus]|uniref:F-box protein SKIP23-like n=1 Tax=Humulus lupulus TaxID=3486 RepID=UPI002B4123F5|nr:F-box protein SKIP23-like [Humulus lupulus]